MSQLVTRSMLWRFALLSSAANGLLMSANVLHGVLQWSMPIMRADVAGLPLLTRSAPAKRTRHVMMLQAGKLRSIEGRRPGRIPGQQSLLLHTPGHGNHTIVVGTHLMVACPARLLLSLAVRRPLRCNASARSGLSPQA
jgi:hypothetical protein